MLRNSPTALRVLKAAMNAAEDGQAGIQVGGGHWEVQEQGTRRGSGLLSGLLGHTGVELVQQVQARRALRLHSMVWAWLVQMHMGGHSCGTRALLGRNRKARGRAVRLLGHSWGRWGRRHRLHGPGGRARRGQCAEEGGSPGLWVGGSVVR